MSSEIVLISESIYGLAMNLQNDITGIILFGNDRLVGVGDVIQKTDQIISIPLGSDGYLGRVVDSLGNFIDGLGAVSFP